MATATRGWQAFRVYLEMIKFEHSIFALPFAMVGMMWGSWLVYGTGWPGWALFGWIVLAMVSCRSAAMAFNRIADRDIDAKNPRTSVRALPAGLLSLKQANLFCYGSIVIFVFAAFKLNSLALALTPVALLFTLGYSITKRFTWLCHFVLGLSLGIAPAAAYIGVSGTVSWGVVAMFAAVAFWTCGFDLIYALQDDDFDRDHRLFSFPAKFGRRKALMASRICHVLAITLLATAGWLTGVGIWGYVGVAFAAAMLAYEQTLVKPDDLSKVNMAFFTLNGFVSIGFFVFALIDVVVRG